MTTRNERLLEEIILFLDGHIKNYEDEFIGGVEIDANSKEEVWDQLKKLIKIEEAK